MNIHIGERIKKRADELGKGPTELAALINTSRQNVVGIYKRPSLDSELLWEISVALSFNFFSLYDSKAIKDAREVAAAQEHSALRKELLNALKEVELLKENNALLKQLLEKKGKKK